MDKMKTYLEITMAAAMELSKKMYKVIKMICRNGWAVMPVLLGIFWLAVLFDINVKSPIIPLAADIWAIYVLGEYYREQIHAMQRKRTLLFLLDAPLCAVFLSISLAFGGTWFLFIVICPSALFLINVKTYIKNACDKKMFTALLFTDPLLHYMLIFALFVIEILANPPL